MAIYQRGKSYYYDFVYKGQRHAGCIGPVSRTVAKEEEARKKAEVIEGRLNPAKARKTPRFDTFAEEYLEWVKANRKPLTTLRVRTTLTHLIAFFGQKKLSDLTPWHLEQYKKERREADMAPATVNLELGMLKAMLRKAQTWGKLAEHPGKEVRPLKGIQGKTRFLSEEEEEMPLSVCSPPLQRIVQAGLLTGFRRQELTSLRPEDIDFARGTVSVAACYSKNGESRTLPLGPQLRAVLEEALAARGDAPIVFITDKGCPWKRSISDTFRRAAIRAGLEPLGPHVLRHTFASRLVMAGVDLRTVQELMGHKTIAMTLRYAHLSPDHKRKAIEIQESRFPAKSPANFHNTPLAAPSSIGQKLLKVS
jgi:integrase